MFDYRTTSLPSVLALGSGTMLITLMALIFVAQWLPIEPSRPGAADRIPVASSTTAAVTPPAPPEQRTYIRIVAGCGANFAGTCVNARSGPGTKYRVIKSLRMGMVLETSGSVVVDGTRWYRLSFDEWLRYPDRVRSAMYVAATSVEPYVLDAPQDLTDAARHATTSKYILVDKSDQMLYAYDGAMLFMKQKISTGLSGTPTPLGRFTVYRKTPSRYMQGPIPGVSPQSYDLPGVPWNLYFTAQGAVIHGAYWHNNFGRPWSHGCVNLPVDAAETLYRWADLGTPVIVRT